MFIIEVIPLTIIPPSMPQILSYFFDKKLERGAVVLISIGNRKVKAIVVDSISLAEHKINLKKADFQLKKISDVILETPQVSDRQFHIALWISKTYYSSLGACLKAVLPPFFLKKKYLTPPENDIKTEKNTKKGSDLILTRAKDSLQNIMSLVKNTVKKNRQTLLIVPDNQTLDYFYENFNKEYQAVKISSEFNNKNLFNSWQNIKSGKIQIIIGTRGALLFPFKNLGLIIVDDPMHEFYKSDMYPRYNASDLAGYIAEINNCDLIYLSPMAGVENYFNLKTQKYGSLNNIRTFLKFLNQSQKTKIINMISEIKSGNFSVLSRELQNSLINLKSKNKKILIFSPRRGHSGILVCQNCGYTVKCPECETAYRIHRSETLILACHRCGKIKKFPDHCSNCNSSGLKPTGPAGSQKIYEEVRRILSKNEIKGIPVLILDADVTKNQTEEDEVINDVTKSEASVLIATQMIFSYRYDHFFDIIAIINTDSLLQSPDFRAEERFFYQFEKMIDFKPETIFLQTYDPKSRALETIFEKNYENFYERELTIRKSLSYPPFSKLIKLTFRHFDKEKASREARILVSKLKTASMQLKLSDKIKITDSSFGYFGKEKGLYAYNIIIKSLTGQTPREILKFIPSRWLIDVDPRTLL